MTIRHGAGPGSRLCRAPETGGTGAPAPVVRLASAAETEAFAQRLAPVMAAGGMVLLDGDLGAGKTAFSRALIRALAGAAIEVPSPTFTLVQLYDLPDLPVVHADLYRIEDPDEIDELGLWEAAEDGLALIEWPDRAGGRLDPGALRLSITIAPDGARLVTLHPSGDWTARLGHLTSGNPAAPGSPPRTCS